MAEKNTRRSGVDRREREDSIDDERRIDPERRDTLHNHLQLIEILEKIPLFHGLSVHQFKSILRICSRRNILRGDTICRIGEESWEFFILLQGALKITFEDGKELSRIDPIGIAGEMGVFTNERRSANIMAVRHSILLSIHKMELMKLFRHDADLGIRVLLNVISDLAKKLRRNNLIIQDLKQYCPPGISTGIILGRKGDPGKKK